MEGCGPQVTGLGNIVRWEAEVTGVVGWPKHGSIEKSLWAGQWVNVSRVETTFGRVLPPEIRPQ